jgi:hypothetical protein
LACIGVANAAAAKIALSATQVFSEDFTLFVRAGADGHRLESLVISPLHVLLLRLVMGQFLGPGGEHSDEGAARSSVKFRSL